MDFKYRKRTFKTPKAGSKKDQEEDTKEKGAVTPSSFTKAGNKRVIKTVPANESEDVTLNYVPLSKRRRKADEESQPATETNNNNNNTTSTKQPSPKKTATAPKKTETSPKKPGTAIKKTEASPKKTQASPKKVEASPKPPQTPSPAKAPTSGPVPLKTPEALRNRKLTHLQKLSKAPLKDLLQSINRDYTGLNSFVVEHFVQIIPEYFNQLAELPDIPRLPKKPRVSSNPENDLLRKKEHVLRHMLERFTEEVKEWEELKAQYPPLKGPAPQPAKSEARDISLSKEGKDAIEKSIQQLILEVDTIKPALRDIHTFNSVADEVCSTMIKQIQQEGFKNYDIQDPKKLIKNIAFSDK